MNVKKLTRLVPLLLMGTTLSAFAADNDTLTVSGTISGNECFVTESTPTLMLPTINTSFLPATGSISASSHPSFADSRDGIYFYIDCVEDRLSAVSFTVTDDQASDLDADSPAGSFALEASEGSPGYYTLSLSEPLINNTEQGGTLMSRLGWLDSYSEHTGEILADNTRQYTLSNAIATPSRFISFKLSPNLTFWGRDKVDPTTTHDYYARFTVNIVF